jgi:hypothetical protein
MIHPTFVSKVLEVAQTVDVRHQPRHSVPKLNSSVNPRREADLAAGLKEVDHALRHLKLKHLLQHQLHRQLQSQLHRQRQLQLQLQRRLQRRLQPKRQRNRKRNPMMNGVRYVVSY